MKKMKRSKAPGFWRIPRKDLSFTIVPSPGPHPRKDCYPLGVLVRDVLGVVMTAREMKASITEGAVLVDGVIRKNSRFPVGLMDMVEVPSLEKVYRMVPKDGSRLIPLEVPDSEKSLKICKVKSKVNVRGGKTQFGFHDGRSLLTEGDIDLSPGDSCIMQVPYQNIVKSLKMEKGALVMITRGKKAGSVAKLEGLKQGTFTRPSLATISFNGETIELAADLLLVVGQEKPAIVVT